MISHVFSYLLAYFGCGPLQNNSNGPKSKVAVIRKKHEKSSKINKNLNCLDAFIDILLVLDKNHVNLQLNCKK